MKKKYKIGLMKNQIEWVIQAEKMEIEKLSEFLDQKKINMMAMQDFRDAYCGKIKRVKMPF